ncbi:MBL fold metallo-hydrolase [Terrisporobacter sp.]
MKLKQIRNATMIITYANKKFLIDPMLAEKGAYPPFPHTHNQHLNNPTVELPVSMEEIIDVDAVIVTHMHLDHLDPAAMELIPKDMKMFAQNEDEADEMKKAGFNNVEVLKEEGTLFGDVKLIKTPAKHYSADSILDIYRELQFTHLASGVIFNHPKEKSLYIMGDTVWYDEIKNVLEKYNPEIVVVNAGNAGFDDGTYLILSKDDLFEATKVVPNAKFVATHMEAVNHATVSRDELREYSEEKGFANRLSIPADGETIEF